MFEEIHRLKILVLRAALLLFLLTCFFFFFGPSQTYVLGVALPLPSATSGTYVVQGYEAMRAALLPPEVMLIAMDPLTALNTHVQLAFLFALALSFPVLLYMIIGFLAPALYARERHALLLVLMPSVILFFTGAWFAYHFVIPPTFAALYGYTKATGTVALFALDAFISTVVGFMLITGVLFLLPILMVLLTSLGIVSASIWREQWRHALLLFIVFSAIITPDGSGVSMVLLALPLCGLYTAGAGLSRVCRPTIN